MSEADDGARYPCAWHTNDGKPCGDDLLPEIEAALGKSSGLRRDVVASRLPRLTVREPSDDEVRGLPVGQGRFVDGPDGKPVHQLRTLMVTCPKCGHLWAVDVTGGDGD